MVCPNLSGRFVWFGCSSVFTNFFYILYEINRYYILGIQRRFQQQNRFKYDIGGFLYHFCID